MLRSRRLRLVTLLACSTFLMGASWLANAGDRWDGSQRAPVVAWRAEIGAGFASVAVQDGTVFAFGNVADEDRITALDIETGKVRWQYCYPCRALGIAKPDERGPRASPLVHAGARSIPSAATAGCCVWTSPQVLYGGSWMCRARWARNRPIGVSAVRPLCGMTD